MSSEEPVFRAGRPAHRASGDAATFEHWTIFAVICIGVALSCAALLMRMT